jgi:hypothetical protein
MSPFKSAAKKNRRSEKTFVLESTNGLRVDALRGARRKVLKFMTEKNSTLIFGSYAAHGWEEFAACDTSLLYERAELSVKCQARVLRHPIKVSG